MADKPESLRNVQQISESLNAKASDICDEVSGGKPKVFGHKFGGYQADVWECTFDETSNGEMTERKTLVKLYKNAEYIPENWPVDFAK